MNDSSLMPESPDPTPLPDAAPISPDAIVYATGSPSKLRCWLGAASVDLTPLFLILATLIVVFPMLSRQKLDHGPNDASRWNTVYYLVEHGTYEYKPDWKVCWTDGRGKSAEVVATMPAEEQAKWVRIGDKFYKPPWDIWGIGPFFTIDMVQAPDGRFVSSKHPLLPTCLAGIVWAIEKTTGYDLGVQRSTIMVKGEPKPGPMPIDPWVILRTTLILAQVVPFLIMVWLFSRYVRCQSESFFVRNFCVAAAALATYLTPYLTTLNNHVIAAYLSLFAVYAAVRIWYDGRRSAWWFGMAGFFAAFAATTELWAGAFAVLLLVVLLVKWPRPTLIYGVSMAMIPTIAAIVTNYQATGTIVPIQAKGIDSPWYQWDGSHWSKNKYWAGPDPRSIDGQAERKGVYLAHLTVGHHGFFLLTPIFVLSLAGMIAHWCRRDDRAQPGLAAFVFVLSLIVFAAVVYKTNNYGGGCQGPRHLFWMNPFWLLMLPAGVELLARSRPGRAVCYACLAVSLFSVYWALPQVGDPIRTDAMGRPIPVERPWSTSWAHELFRQKGGFLPESWRITY